jgi:hypothetical protein
LAGVEPGSYRFDRDDRDELGGPTCPAAIGDHAGELAMRQGERLSSEPIDLLLERRLSGGVVKEEPKGSRVVARGGEERIDARTSGLGRTRGIEALLRPVEHGPG